MLAPVVSSALSTLELTGWVFTPTESSSGKSWKGQKMPAWSQPSQGMYWLWLLGPRRPHWAGQIYGQDPPVGEDQSTSPITYSPSQETKGWPWARSQPASRGPKAKSLPSDSSTPLLPIQGSRPAAEPSWLLESVFSDPEAHPEWCDLVPYFSLGETVTQKGTT